VADIEKTLAQHEFRIGKLEEHAQEMRTAATAMLKASIGIENLTGALREYATRSDERAARHSDRIYRLESKGAKRWDLVITTGITALIMGLVFFALLQLGVTPQ